MPANLSPGKLLAGKLRNALRVCGLSSGLLTSARSMIRGVTSDGRFVGGQTLDNFLAEAGQVLLDTGSVFRLGDTICLEVAEGQARSLITLAVGRHAEPAAGPLLANLIGIEVGDGDGPCSQSLLPAKLVSALLASDALWAAMPSVRYYSRRPAFDAGFAYRCAGWHPDSGILVHGPAVEPIIHEPADDGDGPLDRLPPHLRGLLGEFCWRSDADLVNAVGLLLTGVLINHFVDDPHPVVLVDGNQPGVGKTLLVQASGQVLDGTEPTRIALGRDDELEKRLCAEVRDSRRTVLLLDNVRTRIESAVLEQNVLSPELSFRVLGQSTVVRGPNTFLWAITSNGASGTPDVVRRAVPIRLQHAGDPKARRFHTQPLEYARQHRLAILGELAGMVVRWLQQGKSDGRHVHRCGRWAATIGGILDACGLGRWFLANSEEAEADMDDGLQDLAALAEHLVDGGDGLCVRVADNPNQAGKVPKDWVPAFTATQVLRDQMLVGTDRGKATKVGQFLAARVDRSVHIEARSGPLVATLRCRDGRSRQKLYYFEMAAPPEDGEPPEGVRSESSVVRKASDVSALAGGFDPTAVDGLIDREQRTPGLTWFDEA